MNKSELAASIAEKANLSKKDAEAAVAAFVASVEDALKAGRKSSARRVSVLLKYAKEARDRAATHRQARPSPFLLPKFPLSKPENRLKTLSRNKAKKSAFRRISFSL